MTDFRVFSSNRSESLDTMVIVLDRLAMCGFPRQNGVFRGGFNPWNFS